MPPIVVISFGLLKNDLFHYISTGVFECSVNAIMIFGFEIQKSTCMKESCTLLHKKNTYKVNEI